MKVIQSDQTLAKTVSEKNNEEKGLYWVLSFNNFIIYSMLCWGFVAARTSL